VVQRRDPDDRGEIEALTRKGEIVVARMGEELVGCIRSLLDE
jgi:hypothetical protein